MRQTYFNDSWLINKEYSEWIKNAIIVNQLSTATGDKKIMLSNMGEKAVRNHINRDRYIKIKMH